MSCYRQPLLERLESNGTMERPRQREVRLHTDRTLFFLQVNDFSRLFIRGGIERAAPDEGHSLNHAAVGEHPWHRRPESTPAVGPNLERADIAAHIAHRGHAVALSRDPSG